MKYQLQRDRELNADVELIIDVDEEKIVSNHSATHFTFCSQKVLGRAFTKRSLVTEENFDLIFHTLIKLQRSNNGN